MAVPWYGRVQSRQGTLKERTNAALIISPSRRRRRRFGLGFRAGGASASVAPEVPEEIGSPRFASAVREQAGRRLDPQHPTERA